MVLEVAAEVGKTSKEACERPLMVSVCCRVRDRSITSLSE